MPAAIDIKGKTFGRLTAVRKTEKRDGSNVVWECKCSCGKTGILVGASRLRTGNTKSCGCQKIDSSKANNRTHGLSDTWLYSIWLNIKNRTCVKTNPNYANYGALGINLYSPWAKDYLTFREHMSSLPNAPKFIDKVLVKGKPFHSNITVDRKDGKKGYVPGNVRWATYSEQNRNLSSNVQVRYKGKTMCLTDACAAAGIEEYESIRRWVQVKGLTFTQALAAFRSNTQGKRS